MASEKRNKPSSRHGWRSTRLRESVEPTATQPDPTPGATLVERIKQTDGQWCVYSEDGTKNLGCYQTEGEAEARLAQVETFAAQETAPVTPPATAQPAALAPALVEPPIRIAASKRVPLRASATVVKFMGKPLDDEMRRWPIVVIETGWSANKGPSGKRLYYTAEALRSSLDVWGKAQVYADHPTKTEERELPERSWNKLIGAISDAEYRADVGKHGGVVAVVNIFDEAARLKVKNAYELGMLDRLGGFSINAGGETNVGEVEGQPAELVMAISADQPASVDAVTLPAAGGRFFTKLAASVRPDGGTVKFRTFAELKAANPSAAALLLSAASDEDAKAFLTTAEASTELIESVIAERKAAAAEKQAAEEADKAKTVKAAVDDVTCPQCGAASPAGTEKCPKCGAAIMTKAVETDAAGKEAAKILAEARKLCDEAVAAVAPLREAARASLIESKIAKFDEPTKVALRERLKTAQDEKAIDAEVAYHQSILARVYEASANPFPAGTVRGVESGLDQHDKYLIAFDGYFSGKDEKDASGERVPRFRTLKEAAQRQPKFRGQYVELQPMDLFRECQGWYQGGFRNGKLASWGLRESRAVRLTESSGAWLRESANTTGFGEVWADRAYKRMMTLYHSANDVKECEALASSIEELPDFKTHRIIRLGEYNNPGSVAEGGTYLAATTPADNEESTSLTKYGLVEDISMEALLGEDGKKLRTLPDRMIQAVMRLERQTIINRITTTNPTLNSDSITLYHASHNNTGTTALSIAELAVVERAMQGQTSLTAAEVLGEDFTPAWIIIPRNLRQLAERIVNPSPAYHAAPTNAGTDTALDPHAYKGRIKVLVGWHFSDADNWFAMADPKKVPTFQISRLAGVSQPEFFTQDSEDSPSQFDSDKIKWKVRTFLGVEPLEFRSFYREVV